jgi:hypothetical protein
MMATHQEKTVHIKGNGVLEKSSKPFLSLNLFTKQVALCRREMFVTPEATESGKSIYRCLSFRI